MIKNIITIFTKYLFTITGLAISTAIIGYYLGFYGFKLLINTIK